MPEAEQARKLVVDRIENTAWADIVSIVERLGMILPEVDQRRMLRVLAGC
jgi:hypothetical protein